MNHPERPARHYALESLSRSETVLEMLVDVPDGCDPYLFGLTPQERKAVAIVWKRIRRWKVAVLEDLNEFRARRRREKDGRHACD